MVIITLIFLPIGADANFLIGISMERKGLIRDLWRRRLSLLLCRLIDQGLSCKSIGQTPLSLLVLAYFGV